MSVQSNTIQNTDKEEQDIYTFKQEDNVWYIHLPQFLERGWKEQDLCLAEGARKFLNLLSNGAKNLHLRISTQPLPNAGTLELVEHCEAPRGGAIYLFMPAAGHSQGELFWICDLALFVFGDMPDRIYVQRLPGKVKPAFQMENFAGRNTTAIHTR
jgi:hypothetical protein